MTLSPKNIIITNIGRLYNPGKSVYDPPAIVDDTNIIIKNSRIAYIGNKKDIPLSLTKKSKFHEIKAHHGLIIPGLIDCHTHSIFAGNRSYEMELKFQNVPYIEILKKGGGIHYTVEQTRNATKEELKKSLLSRITQMLKYGVTTVEIKSGYGLDIETELKCLQVIKEVSQETPQKLIPTYLGAHTIPKEFLDNPSGYVDLIINQCLPTITKKKLAQFCDIYVEDGAFSYDQAKIILTKAKELGLPIKIHAEQITNCGGAKLAAELSAISADHLEKITEHDCIMLKQKNVTPVLLPGAAFFLRDNKTSFVEYIKQQKLDFAIATDFNPGSSPIINLLLCGTLAMQRWGLSTHQILYSMTKGAAKALALPTFYGEVALGQKPNFSIFDVSHENELFYWMGQIKARKVIIGSNIISIK